MRDGMTDDGQGLLDGIEVPVLRVDPAGWVVRYANRCAREWLGVSVGDPLLRVMPGLELERIATRLGRGREARHEQKTAVEPSFMAHYFFRSGADGSVVVEGRNAAAAEEAEAMVASYSALIEKQKAEIEVEKARVEKLLLNILPRKTVEQLRQFGRAVPERFDNVTVMFLDFVGFTALSRELTPCELFNELNEIFSGFDEIIARHGCERIKTIGDAYLAVCGMPDPNLMHAPVIVHTALEMRAFIRKRNLSSPRQWTCRIGIHSGSVTAGVVGRLKYIYDIFGDGVNTASRMEGYSETMQVNISGATRALLGDAFALESRGVMEVKGSGPMEMFFVHGEPDNMAMPPAGSPGVAASGVEQIFDGTGPV